MKKGKIPELEWEERFTYRKNVPFGENELRCKGAKFQVVSFAPGKRIAPHYHRKTCEIFFVHSGQGAIVMNNKRFECVSGDFFLCEPSDIHSFENTGDEDFIILVFKTNEGGDKDIFF